MTTHNVTFKPGASSLAALTVPLATYLEGYDTREDRYILPNVPFEYMEKLGETLIESGATEIEVSGIHMLRVAHHDNSYPKDFVKQAVAKLFLATGIDVNPLVDEPVGFTLDARSETNAREILRGLRMAGHIVAYLPTPIGNVSPKQIRFTLNPNHKIDAIRLVRMWTDEGLKWCKDTVEAGSITLSGGPLRIQAFQEALAPFVYGYSTTVTPLETFTLPKTLKDKEALAAHLEALAKLIRTMDI